MKDDQIRIRVDADEKATIARDAKAAGFDGMSAYLLNLARKNRSRLRK